MSFNETQIFTMTNTCRDKILLIDKTSDTTRERSSAPMLRRFKNFIHEFILFTRCC